LDRRHSTAATREEGQLLEPEGNAPHFSMWRKINLVSGGVLIKGKFLALTQYYLRRRYQKALTDKFNAYGNASSGWKKITNGVP